MGHGVMYGTGCSYLVPCELSFSLLLLFLHSRSHRPGASWKHEQASEMMLDDLVRENNIPITEEDQNFIKALILGEHSRTLVIFVIQLHPSLTNHSVSPQEKAFLFDIVANKRNGLDVDKLSLSGTDIVTFHVIRLLFFEWLLTSMILFRIDYIHRDSHMVGDPIHLSPTR